MACCQLRPAGRSKLSTTLESGGAEKCGKRARGAATCSALVRRRRQEEVRQAGYFFPRCSGGGAEKSCAAAASAGDGCAGARRRWDATAMPVRPRRPGAGPVAFASAAANPGGGLEPRSAGPARCCNA